MHETNSLNYPSAKVLRLTKQTQQALSVHSSWRREKTFQNQKARDGVGESREGNLSFLSPSSIFFNLVPFHQDQRKMLSTVCGRGNRTENSTEKISHRSGAKHKLWRIWVLQTQNQLSTHENWVRAHSELTWTLVWSDLVNQTRAYSEDSFL